MDITKMTDQEKSVLLAKAMGGKLGIVPSGWGELIGENLYDPANMALAWRVHLWAWWGHPRRFKYRSWFMNHAPHRDNAQRLWLDKILELAIEAGLVEGNDDN